MSRCMQAGRSSAPWQRGFTLIEVLVASALFGLLALSLFESARFGQRSYSKVIGEGAKSWELLLSQRRIRSILESAYPQEPRSSGVTPYGLDAQTETLAVTAAAPLAAGGAGLYRYQMMLSDAAGGTKNLVIRWAPDYAGGDLSAAQLTEEVLIEAVRSVEWSFLDAAGPADASTAVWRHEWRERRSLPRLIRLRVVFDVRDGRYWPDLVVAPRITDDANCAFDIVAQRCRASI